MFSITHKIKNVIIVVKIFNLSDKLNLNILFANIATIQTKIGIKKNKLLRLPKIRISYIHKSVNKYILDQHTICILFKKIGFLKSIFLISSHSNLK